MSASLKRRAASEKTAAPRKKHHSDRSLATRRTDSHGANEPTKKQPATSVLPGNKRSMQRKLPVTSTKREIEITSASSNTSADEHDGDTEDNDDEGHQIGSVNDEGPEDGGMKEVKHKPKEGLCMTFSTFQAQLADKFQLLEILTKRRGRYFRSGVR